ncbi:MAG: hypothetical protein ACPHID_05130 [Thermoplasmatota archaeon]
MKPWIALLLLPLAGCVAFEEADPTPIYSDDEIDAWFHEAKQARFTLADFANDTLLLQVLTQAKVHAELQLHLPQSAGLSAQGAGDESTPRPCISYISPEFRAVGFGSLRHPMVATQVAGQEATVTVPSYDGSYIGGWDHEFSSYQQGTPVNIALALADVEAWGDAPLMLTLRSELPFHYRVLQGGSMHCMSQITEMEGTAADFGLASVASDLDYAFASDALTMTGVYFGATGRFAGHLEGPHQFYKEFQGANGYVFQMGFLDPGDYRLHIAEMVAAQDPAGSMTWPSGAVAMHHSVPAWVLAPPWEPHRVEG